MTVKRFELVAQIDLDTGTENLALVDLSMPSTFYRGRISNFGELRQEISVIPGEFRIGSFSLEIDNSGNFFSESKGGTPWLNRDVKILIGDADLGEGDFTVTQQGRVQGFSSSDQEGRDILTLEVIDKTLVKFDQPLSPHIDNSLFPDVPVDVPHFLVPQCIGEVTSVGFSAVGAMPAYRIDPASSQAKYRYVAMLGAAKSIDKVYIYGVEKVGGFTTSQVTFGTTEVTVIDFDADPLDAARSDEIEISWDGKGITDDGLTSGTLITNPASAYESALLANGLVAVEIDSTIFTAVAAILDGRGITAGVAIVGHDETLRGVAERMAQSFNMSTFVTDEGKVGITVPSPNPSGTYGLISIDENQIARASLSMSNPEAFASQIEYRYSPNWPRMIRGDEDFFEGNQTFSSTQEEVQLGEEIKTVVDFWYIRSSRDASAIANDLFFFLREQRVVVDVLVGPELIRQIAIGDDIKMTHFAGMGLAGFSSEIFRCISRGYTIEDNNLVGSLRLIDMTDAVFALTKLYERYLDQEPTIKSDLNPPITDIGDNRGPGGDFTHLS